MTRYTCKTTAVFSVSEWTDNEQDTKFYDLYINGKFASRHTSMTTLQSAILKIIHDRS